MKIKKTLAIIITATLSLGTLAGCSQATQNYSKEIYSVNNWEAKTYNITGSVSVDAQDIKEELAFTCTAYQAKDNEYADIKFTDPKGKINIPEFKYYSDGTTEYINKSFFEGINTLSGQTIPSSLANIKEDYIGIDIASSETKGNQIESLLKDPDALPKLGKIIFGDSDIDLPIAQNGREYTINLDADKTVDLSAKAIKAAFNNLDNINSNFGLKLPAENIAEMKAAVNDQKFDASLKDIKTALAGTTITSKKVFTDNSYISDCNINLQIKDFGKVSVKLNSTTTKSEVKSVDMPASKIKLTEEEFDNALDLSAKAAVIPASTNVVAK